MRSISLSICLSFLIIFSVPAKTYTVAFPDNKFYPQYELIDGQMKGLLPDIMLKFAGDVGILLSFKAYPIKRYVQLFDQGEIDFVLPDNPLWLSKDQENRVKYSKSIISSPVGFYERSTRKIKSLSDVKSVATISGYVLTPFETEIETSKIKAFYSKKISSLVQMLLKERTDLIFFHEQILRQMLREDRILSKTIQKNNILPSITYNYHLSSIKFSKILDQFDEWLARNQSWIEERASTYQLTFPQLPN